MTEDVGMLKGLALRNPVGKRKSLLAILINSDLQAILKLEGGQDEAALLSQYSVR